MILWSIEPLFWSLIFNLSHQLILQLFAKPNNTLNCLITVSNPVEKSRLILLEPTSHSGHVEDVSSLHYNLYLYLYWMSDSKKSNNQLYIIFTRLYRTNLSRISLDRANRVYYNTLLCWYISRALCYASCLSSWAQNAIMHGLQLAC